MFTNFRRKSQSAIEYLMTYGWAILIIGIVLAILFRLGVFSPQGAVVGCSSYTGFLCTGPVLNQSGFLSASIGQVGYAPLYDVSVACSAALNTTGLPSNASAWTLVQANGLGIPFSQLAGRGENPSNGTVLISSQAMNIKEIPCYGADGTLFATPGSPSSVSASFTGTLWINYTTKECTPGSSGCTPNIQKLATLQLKVA